MNGSAQRAELTRAAVLLPGAKSGRKKQRSPFLCASRQHAQADDGF
jgi:hypothetical protein